MSIKRARAVSAAATAVLAAALTTAAVLPGDAPEAHSEQRRAVGSAHASGCTQTGCAPTNALTPASVAPTAKDFTVDLQTTRKQCFGPASCTMTVNPKIDYHGPADMPSLSCDLTYEITGDKSGTVTETAQGNSAGSFEMQPTTISPRSSTTKPAARMVDVRCGGFVY